MVLNYVALGLILMAVVVITLGIIKIHQYPGMVARARNHPQAQAIEVTSVLGLIIFPFWMVALVWAYSNAVVGVLYASDADAGGEASPEGREETETPEPTSDAGAQG